MAYTFRIDTLKSRFKPAAQEEMRVLSYLKNLFTVLSQQVSLLR